MIVSYTIAAPIWKTTYRVVLDQEGKPFFQGWAIVDNVSEENWQNVQLSLVSGSPISFIQNLQKPFYRYRPIIPTPQDLQLSPQVYEPQSGFGSGNGNGSSGNSTSISGTVTDANGAVVPNATIVLTNDSTNAKSSVATDGDGEFEKSELSPGNYTALVNASGFKTTVIRSSCRWVGRFGEIRGPRRAAVWCNTRKTGPRSSQLPWNLKKIAFAREADADPSRSASLDPKDRWKAFFPGKPSLNGRLLPRLSLSTPAYFAPIRNAKKLKLCAKTLKE
jgi:hypothetical protein